MLVLAIDTATPAVTAGVVEVTADAVLQRSTRVEHDARKHAELLMPAVQAVCADAGTSIRGLAAVVVGTGPGPFTGLRVGMVTAAALGDALGVPVHGVCSLDAIATDALGGDDTAAGPLLVVTDARRREVYWAAYDGTGGRQPAEPAGWVSTACRRVDGPHVQAPAEVAVRARELGATAAAGGSGGLVGLPVRSPESPSPVGLVTVAAPALRAGAAPAPLEPLYLRRPDAAEPGARKRVSA